MSKISVIIAHEYKTRVKNKWFIIATLLGPLGLALLIAIPVLAAVLAGNGAEGKVAIIDKSGLVANQVIGADTSTYVSGENSSEAELAKRVTNESLQAYIIVPENILDGGKLVMYSRGGSGIAFEQSVADDFEPHVVRARLQRVGTDTSVIDLVERGVSLTALTITEEGLKEDSSAASAAIGYAAGFVIYMLIFLYGSLVMRGVIEEKTNRIVEVLASSAKPFEIMMGKVVGIGLVGLTQVAAWIVLGVGVTVVLGSVLSGAVDPQAVMEQSQQLNPGMAAAQTEMTPKDLLGEAGIVLPDITIWSVLLFVFFFLAGYFIYATMFAAVGSAVDQEADAQQLTLPITLPVIFTIMFIGNVVAAPNSTLAVVLSLIPLFSPILMTVRVAATNVPLWQILSSVVLTIGMFITCVWVAGKIYRVGILSYGKKPSIKDLVRWVR